MIAVTPTTSKGPCKLRFLSGFVTTANAHSALQTIADTQWDALPAHFRLEGDLKKSNNSPFERDFLISIRLNYLHISFLIRRLLLRRLAEPDVSILEVAQQMLHLVVDAVLLRDELANSGTALDWKVCIEIVRLGRS